MNNTFDKKTFLKNVAERTNEKMLKLFDQSSYAVSYSDTPSKDFESKVSDILSHKKKRNLTLRTFFILAAALALALAGAFSAIAKQKTRYYTQCECTPNLEDSYDLYVTKDDINGTSRLISSVYTTPDDIRTSLYIPHGFSEIDYKHPSCSESGFIAYRSSEHYISISYGLVQNDMLLNFSNPLTASYSFSKTEINQWDGFISTTINSENEFSYDIVWSDGRLIYQINTNLDMATTIKIAESVKI